MTDHGVTILRGKREHFSVPIRRTYLQDRPEPNADYRSFIPHIDQKIGCIFRRALLATKSYMAEHAVVVKFDYVATNLDALFELEDRLSDAIAEASEGECDGHAITPDLTEATIYVHGPDAEFLFVVAQQVLEYTDCVHNGVATLRFGPPEDGVRERGVRLTRRCT